MQLHCPRYQAPQHRAGRLTPCLHHCRCDGCEHTTNLLPCACSSYWRGHPHPQMRWSCCHWIAELQGEHAAGQATPRQREKRRKPGMERTLSTVSGAFVLTPTRPASIAISQIGQGASGGVYTTYQIGTNLSIAINEILVMRSSCHPDIKLSE